MKIVGIVAEYNPFHAGHRHHIEQTRRRVGEECAVVAAMSGNFVQRGDAAIADKWTRAGMALEGGVDLVVELPTVWAASSAEHFAFGGVSVLKLAGADTLSFGSESGRSQGLKQAAAVVDSQPFKGALRRHLDEGLPFALCRQRAVEELAGAEVAACLSSPNDNLGVEYLKAARRLGFDPQVITVPRVGAPHDGGDHPEYPSASRLRELMLAGAMPADHPGSLKFNGRGVLSRLRQMTAEDFERLPDCGEGLAIRLYQASRTAVTLDQVYDLAKTKRYAHSRIRRAVLWAALGLNESDRPAQVPYLRVLGANQRGREVLRAVSEDVTVITKPAHGRGIPLMELEARCTDFYGLCRERILPCGGEWTTSPVIR